MEQHPRITLKDGPLVFNRIILGSFPTWSLTSPDVDKGETQEEKNSERNKSKDFDFFYGSSSNQFWKWYKRYINESLITNDVNNITSKLAQNAIGITDMIVSCTRHDRSALDKHLSNRVYNHNFFAVPKNGTNIKILCTSKGVMNDMLLSNTFFNKYKGFSINIEKSKAFEIRLLAAIGGRAELVKKPFYISIDTNEGGSFECLSLPSPGSPYRRLIDFGYGYGIADDYLNAYLSEAFQWFIN